MPVHDCTSDGKPGYQYGSQTCYTYSPNNEAARKKAKQQAYLQGAAIEASQRRQGQKPKSDAVELTVTKQFETEITLPQSVSPELRAKINAFALEDIPDDQIYVSRAKLANDAVDRSHERFPVEYLRRFAETIPGKSLLPGHDRTAVPIGRWIQAGVEPDGRGGHDLVADFYVDAKSEIARRLRMGIAKDVSISFKAAGRTCDLCGAPYDGQKGCEHVKGQEYDGKLCTVTYSGDTRRVEAIEGSLVWLACQNGAQVVGSKAAGPFGGQVIEQLENGDSSMTDEERIALEARIKMLEDEKAELVVKTAFNEDGKAYHAFLKSEVARLRSSVSGKTEDAELWLKSLEGTNLEGLQHHLKMAQESFDAKFPPSAQSKILGEGAIPAPPPSAGTGVVQPESKFDPLASFKSYHRPLEEK